MCAHPALGDAASMAAEDRLVPSPFDDCSDGRVAVSPRGTMHGMHRLRDATDERPVIDHGRACDAIAAIGDREHLLRWARRFHLLGDPTRLALLLAIRHAGPIAVSDLAVAVGVSGAATSHALRLLRTEGAVVAQREGRVIRYALGDDELRELLDRVHPDPELHHLVGDDVS
jgi:DNA-binding transcriptional ArsR family regulator